MTKVFHYGIAKTQKLPYSNWENVRSIQSKGKLVNFFKQDEIFFRSWLLKRTSPRKVDQIFRKGFLIMQNLIIFVKPLKALF